MEALNTRAVQSIISEAVDGGDFLHVWRASLQAHRGSPDLVSTLSSDEEERARAFIRPGHGEAFSTGRGLLRTLLAFYLGDSPAVIRFEYGASGKPALASASGPRVSFNVAHSGDELVFAVSDMSDVGVDLERVREDVDRDMIIQSFFSDTEAAELAGLPQAERTEAFFKVWTRKEAYMKARGDGFSLHMNRFAVACPPAPASLLWVDGMQDEPSRWTLTDLEVGPAFAATVAVEHPAPPLHFRRWLP